MNACLPSESSLSSSGIVLMLRLCLSVPWSIKVSSETSKSACGSSASPNSTAKHTRRKFSGFKLKTAKKDAKKKGKLIPGIGSTLITLTSNSSQRSRSFSCHASVLSHSILMMGLRKFSWTVFDFWYKSWKASVVDQHTWHMKLGNASDSAIWKKDTRYELTWIEKQFVSFTSHLKCSLIISLIFCSIPITLNTFKSSVLAEKHRRHEFRAAILNAFSSCGQLCVEYFFY